MAVCYVDTSALLKRFVSEAGAAEFEVFVEQYSGDLLISPLHLTEFASALQRRVRMKEIHSHYALAAYQHLQTEIASGSWLILPMSTTVYSKASQLIQTIAHPIATLDALHLAAALELRETKSLVEFATADRQLATAAAGVQLKVHYFAGLASIPKL